MNKNDVYQIIEEQKIFLFKKYAEAESVLDKRMKIQNDGVSYSGMDFIKYVPDKTDRNESAKSRGYYWPDVCILYFGKQSSYGLDDFIIKREARTTTGQHIRSAFRVLNNVECNVQTFKKGKA